MPATGLNILRQDECADCNTGTVASRTFDLTENSSKIWVELATDGEFYILFSTTQAGALDASSAASGETQKRVRVRNSAKGPIIVTKVGEQTAKSYGIYTGTAVAATISEVQ